MFPTKLIDMPTWSQPHQPLKIICDFDGTITPFDVTDALLAKFADPQWEEVEQKWLAGEICARDCMDRQIRLIRAEPRALDAFLDEIPITPGFNDFIDFCRGRGLTLTVVSDGLDYSIKRVLKNHGLGELPVVANQLLADPDGYSLAFPHGRDGCGSGVCKCGVAEKDEAATILIGDGHSDCCVAGKAALVLAKSGRSLQAHCRAKGYPNLIYDDFHDVVRIFKELLNFAEEHGSGQSNLAANYY